MKKGGRHSAKFSPLSPADIEKEKILLSGRHKCTCEATKHGLVSNCLECGRIVCEQEGSGPCFTCGALVCTPKEQEILLRESKASQKLYIKLMGLDGKNHQPSVSQDSKLQSALDHRDKLLEYDRTVEMRTKVIDDEADYFQTDSRWLNEKERKLLKKKKEEIDDMLHNRRNQKFSLDFAGRKIVEEKPEINFDIEEYLKSNTSIFESDGISTDEIASDIHPVYEDLESDYEYDYSSEDKEQNKRLLIRIQDKDLQEMSDEGNCLSLHQPHASLLVAGIKKHEGRVWYTSYRGRLWIHSAGKTPTKQDISDIVNLYRSIQKNLSFPKIYPPSCLLGCVDVVDCLPQEEYKAQFPSGEIASPYVFICENAKELNIKFPMKGKHKIFKLDSKIHQAAKKTLMRLT